MKTAKLVSATLCIIFVFLTALSEPAVGQERGSIGMELLDGEWGVEIGRLRKDGPGLNAGLRTKDRIRTVNNRTVARVADVAQVLKNITVGDKIEITVNVVGKYFDVVLVADKTPTKFDLVRLLRNDNKSLVEKDPVIVNSDDCPARKVAVRGGYQTIQETCKADFPLIGASLRNFEARLPGYNGISSTLQITKIRENGPLQAAGLQVGDLIFGCNHSRTLRIPAVQNCMEHAREGLIYDFNVYRQGTPAVERIKITLSKDTVGNCNVADISGNDLLSGKCGHLLKREPWPYLRVIDGKPPFSEKDYFATQRAMVLHYVTLFFSQCKSHLPANAASYQHNKDVHIGTIDYIWRMDHMIFKSVYDYTMKLHPGLYNQYTEVAEVLYGEYFKEWKAYNKMGSPNEELHTYMKLVEIRADEVKHDLDLMFQVDGCSGSTLTRFRQGLEALG
ncbi:PDZ domain-containing protein [Thalassobaculum litoreum]|uniref:PDZ domain-containing protein n=1 Tax=Thalassobaculum litoreum DSM 18839 TaxID=1123362 RepID=A0A8G2BMT5_9PROT|nr:PDZ domain-containing protein [Thalassobaculum litoreum]SDG60009.1 hypothetical protein SAMN05660686_04982 [Thalassobaculum litoreum DSM 18839]